MSNSSARRIDGSPPVDSPPGIDYTLPMPTIHPTASLEGDVHLADDVSVGPHCVLTGPITLGAGCRLVGNVYLQGPLTLGRENVIYPFACLGFAPQHAHFDPATPGHGLAIGDGNTFREQVTVHRAYTDDGPTRIGDRNTFMVGSHVGHDTQVGNDCTLVNAAMLGGHVTVADHVLVGGGAGVHQFCRIGRGAMLAGVAGITQDLPPYFLVTSMNLVSNVNIVGLRRSGVARDVIDDVRWVFRVVYRRGLTTKNALAVLREREDRPIVAEYLQFIETSDRGIVPAHGRLRRGTVTA